MIAALEIIGKKLDGKATEWLTDFGDWLVNKLTFLYFDMETRKNGEETFVIINTTGEPLSATQNLKPLVLKADINKEIEDAAEKWEEIETWFWKKRIVENGNDTADAGFAEFLRWITIVYMSNRGMDVGDILQGKRNCDFPYNDISVMEIENTGMRSNGSSRSSLLIKHSFRLRLTMMSIIEELSGRMIVSYYCR